MTYSVADGTASGCEITNGVLTATSPGTCVVTVTKAADATYLAISASQIFTFTAPPLPGRVTVRFVAGGSTLTAAETAALRAFGATLLPGAVVLITVDARGENAAAHQRLSALERLFHSFRGVHLKVRFARGGAAPLVYVRALRQ